MFAVFLVKVRINKELFWMPCTPRHYLVYLQENKVVQDRRGFTAHVVARKALLAVSALDRTLLCHSILWK